MVYSLVLQVLPSLMKTRSRGKLTNAIELINTTEKLFGPLLHQYTVDEAIADGNVLGFHVDYINTGEFRSYEDLREDLIELLTEKHQKKLSKRLNVKSCGCQNWM